MEAYETLLPQRSKGLMFIKALRAKRKRDTAVSYMTSYERYWIPLDIHNDKGEQLWFLLIHH